MEKEEKKNKDDLSSQDWRDLQAAVAMKIATCQSILQSRLASRGDRDDANKWLPMWMRLSFKIENKDKDIS